MKATAIAPSNLAFVKYWGKKDDTLRLPENGSISMNLSGLQTTTTVEFSPMYSTDSVWIDGKEDEREGSRVITHLNLIRSMAGISECARVVSHNSFPSGTGLSSSASGFAALSMAASSAAKLHLSEKELSVLARLGSGSACRGIPSGFVEWIDGDSSDSSYGVSLFSEDHWNLCDIVAVVSEEKKDISTSEGQKTSHTSPFFESRLQGMCSKIDNVKEAIAQKDFQVLGELSEREALEMHAIMITSWPPLLYWKEKTLTLMKQIHAWRRSGEEVYFSLNTGQDVHVLCEQKNEERILALLTALPYVRDTIINYPVRGAKILSDHLF